MVRNGNVCPCGRMIFSVRDVLVSDPENPRTTLTVPGIMYLTCLGCGQDLVAFKGLYKDVPVSPRLPEGQERLRLAVKSLFDFRDTAQKVSEAEKEPVVAPTSERLTAAAFGG